jgi:hypothetical protein
VYRRQRRSTVPCAPYNWGGKMPKPILVKSLISEAVLSTLSRAQSAGHLTVSSWMAKRGRS